MAGGYRPGSGAKKGQYRVHVKELKAAMEASLGMKWEEHLAQSQLKLFQDFLNDKNVKEYVMFTEHMNKRILADQIHEVNVTTEELTKEEIDNRIANLQSRLMLSAKQDSTKTDSDES